MKKTSLLTACLLTATLTLPSVAAFDWPDWLEFDGPDFTPPEPSPVTDDARLEGLEGMYSVTTLTGLTDLTVLSYDNMDLLLRPKTDHLELQFVPDEDLGRPTQTTRVNDTTSLTLVQTPFYTWIDGAEPMPPQMATDPTYIYESSVPDVSVPNPVVLNDLIPRAKAGTATMTTTAYNVYDPSTGASTIAFTLLDVDDRVRLLDTMPVYHVNSTITSATTSLAIKTLLDEFSLAGTDLAGVLNGLKLSTDEVGIVDIDGVASYLSLNAFTVRKIVHAGTPPVVNYDLDSNQIDFVNPATLGGNVVLLKSAELQDMDDGKIIALKDPVNERDTKILHQYTTFGASPSPCLCFVSLEFDSAASGFTTAVATLTDTKLKMAPSLNRVIIDPATSLPIPTPGGDEDFGPGMNYRAAYVGSVDDFRPETAAMMMPGPSHTPPPSINHPKVHADTLMIAHAIDLDPDDYSALLRDTLADWKAKFGDLNFVFCTTCVPRAELDDYVQYLGQLEAFVPRQTIVAPDTASSGGYVATVLGASNQLVQLAPATETIQLIDDVYSTVRLRAVTDKTRLGIGGAGVEFNVVLPGFQGNTVQTFTAETNDLGYAAFSVLPNQAYNFTVVKEEFSTYSGVGASPGPGEEQGKDVRMSTEKGFYAFAEAFASPAVAMWSLAALLLLLLLYVRVKKGKRSRRSRRSR